MDCSPPGPSAHGMVQARILELVAISPLGHLPDPGLNPRVPCLLHWWAGSLPWATWDAPVTPCPPLSCIPAGPGSPNTLALLLLAHSVLSDLLITKLYPKVFYSPPFLQGLG